MTPVLELRKANSRAGPTLAVFDNPSMSPKDCRRVEGGGSGGKAPSAGTSAGGKQPLPRPLLAQRLFLLKEQATPQPQVGNRPQPSKQEEALAAPAAVAAHPYAEGWRNAIPEAKHA